MEKLEISINNIPNELLLIILTTSINSYRELYYVCCTFAFRTVDGLIDRLLFAKLLFELSKTVPLEIKSTFKRPPIRFAIKDGQRGFYQNVFQIAKLVITQNIRKDVPICCFVPLSLIMINSCLAYSKNAPIRNMKLEYCFNIILKYIDVKIYDILFLHKLNKNVVKQVSIINNMNRTFNLNLLNGFTKITHLDVSTTLISNPEGISELSNLHVLKVNPNNISIVLHLPNNLEKLFIKVIGNIELGYTANIILALYNFRSKNIYATIICHITNGLLEFAKSNDNLRLIGL